MNSCTELSKTQFFSVRGVKKYYKQSAKIWHMENSINN